MDKSLAHLTMSYTSIEPAAIKFYYNDKRVLQIYMLELRLYMEAASDVRIGVGVTNPTTSFDVGNYIFLKSLRGMTEKMSFQLTNPGYNNQPYSFVPIATIVIWGASSIPENWLECNGQQVLQKDYPYLFDAIGYKYTSTENQNANASKSEEQKIFQVPDFRGGVAVIQRKSTGTGFNSKVGERYPGVPSTKERDVDIETQFAPLRSSIIQQFVLRSEQLPPHRHQFKADVDVNGSTATRYALKAHTHTYTRCTGSLNVTAGGRGGIYYNNTEETSGSTNFSHKHPVSNVRLLEAYKNNKNDPTKAPANPTWNNPFSIEQQYIIMKYIIKAG